jgi:hypothetical protein
MILKWNYVNINSRILGLKRQDKETFDALVTNSCTCKATLKYKCTGGLIWIRIFNLGTS